jgi:hypothetical protein
MTIGDGGRNGRTCPIAYAHQRTFEWLQARILAPVDAVIRIVDQDHCRRRHLSCRRIDPYDGLNVHKSNPIIIHDGLVKPTYDKVYRPTCLYFDFVRDQLVFVAESIIGEGRGNLSSGGSVCHWLKLTVALGGELSSAIAVGASNPMKSIVTRHIVDSL